MRRIALAILLVVATAVVVAPTAEGAHRLDDALAPTARDDSATLVAPRSITVDVLANDSSPSAFVSVSATDGLQGFTTVNPDLTISYTPGVSASTMDSFDYEACTADGCASAVVALSVTPPECAGVEATIWGTHRAEEIRGTDDADVIVTFGSGAYVDRVSGLGGDDLICITKRGYVTGGDGNDQIFGGTGVDLLRGEQGDDIIRGGGGNDGILGQAGDDRLYGDDGNDTVAGGEGNDQVRGGAGDDNLNGGVGNDRLLGQAGQDDVFGGDGADVQYGGDGADRLYGGPGDDRIYGNGDNDRLFGYSGSDLLDGGAGDADTCNGDDGDDRATRCERITSIP